MQYLTKTITLTITIPNTEVGATDYIQIFSNNGSGDVDLGTPLSGKIAGVASLVAAERIYIYSFRITTPALWKFKYRVYDAAGNLGTTSGEFPIAWANNTSYAVGQEVLGYRCKLAHTSGGDGVWTLNTPYALGDRVYVGARNNTTYICTTATTGDATFPAAKFTADNDQPETGAWATYWDETDMTLLVPAKASSLSYVSYNGTTKVLVLAT